MKFTSVSTMSVGNISVSSQESVEMLIKTKNAVLEERKCFLELETSLR